ncbi:hypothetical protein GMD78_10775 [Ornithinibacillus sp. L9]|uniref:DNA-binding transcriptional regulator SgrR of sgrS sRNA, contains a MarR-type HTH domain and a solute-binding domain n=1 Tax=Ornithinibacillus caprae TaxID=2678566 RepID=A0A6N8FJK8_9BACI|nr:ABC transporter substrate-binding protein [Ornithinibacillus caprae]MUK88876.1 hypothetical protein [Ornithinibacillus caprae]
MKYMEYVRILTTYFTKNVQVETTIAQLARLFNCSERHTKSIVNYLDQHNWIKWEVQRGRGKKPKLTLFVQSDDILYQEAINKVGSEKYQEAFRLLQQMDSMYQDRFQTWFKKVLGISQTKTEDEEPLDVLRYPFYETMLSMDPLTIMSRHDSHMVQQIFDRLVAYDPKSDKLIPQIAHHWETVDGIRWYFYLRKQVMFHHGRELTSNDVKATIDRLPKYDVIKKNLVTIEIRNQTVIIFKLKETDYLFPRYLATMKASIIPIEMVEQNEINFRKKPIGSGPYQLTRHDQEKVQLDVFLDYYGYRPWLDRIEIIKTPEKLVGNQSHPFLLSAPDSSWKGIKVQEEGADYITFNCRKDGPLKNIYYRRLLCNLIDEKEFCLHSNHENESVAHSFLTERSKEKTSKTKVHDNVNEDMFLQIAAQQIREGVNHKREALILQSQLERAGISSSVEIVNAQDLGNPQVLNKFDIVVAGIALTEDRLLSVLTAIQSSQLTIYPSLNEQMRNEVDQQVSALKKLHDTTRQWQMYVAIEDYLKSNHAIFFLNHRTHTVYEPNNSQYMNIKLDSNGRVDYRKVWKKE